VSNQSATIYFNDTLEIDASGVVTVPTGTDFEARNQYSFNLVAEDEIGNTSEQSVAIEINNLDEIAPTITSSDTAAAIDENSGAGQVVHTASADDSADVSGGITYTLEDTTQYVSFPESVISIPTIQASTQHVYVSSSEKSEDGSQETVVITYSANDNTLTGLGVRIHFDSSKLTLTDISDILGGSLSDPTIGSVASDDSNHDSNASTDKYLTLAYADPFSGNWPNQGLPLDLITLTYDLVEGATGNAAIGFSATSTASGYTLDAQVHNVALTGESTSVESQLSINSATGEVMLLGNTDYEALSQYNFTVIADDGVNNAVEQSVTLDINNLDEIAPTITSGDTAVAIDENSGAGQLIYTAVADDSQDISAGVTFSLAGADAAAFSINAGSGDVTLTADPNFESQNQYNFIVVADDGVNTPVEKAVTLDINNLDEIAPTIDSGATATAIDENSGAGQVVYTATADDTQDISAGVTFSLAGTDAAAFSIDATSGDVTLTANPNFESQSQYNFIVVANDGVTTPDEKAVTLDINNLDEVAPTIISASEVIAVNLGQANPVIYTAEADDTADISGGITYTLEDTTQYVSFPESVISIPTIQASTQHVYVSSSEKSEDGSQETVVITYSANDNTLTGLGVRIHFDSSKLTLTDISNIFGGSLSDPTIGSVASDDSNHDGNASTDKYLTLAYAAPFAGNWPNQGLPLDLITLTYDLVEGATGNAAIGFSATSTASGYTLDAQAHNVALTGESTSVESQLSINSATGEVIVDGELDPAVQSEYSFTITAEDAAGNSNDLGVVIDVQEPKVMALLVDGQIPSAPIYQASSNTEDASFLISDLTQYPDTDTDGDPQSVVSIPTIQASTQHVYVSSSEKSEDGSQETVVITYSANDNTLTGLGVRIHFDSSKLTLTDISNIFGGSLSDPTIGSVASDDSNHDGNASTDKYLTLAYAAPFAGNWPNQGLPLDLITLTYDLVEGATGNAAIGFSATSNASGYTLDGQVHNVAITVDAPEPAAELVIDNAAGTVSLDDAANSETMAVYSFSVDTLDAQGNAIGSQTVPVVVVDQVVNADASSYTGTAEADVFALADGSADITSDAGADVFVLDPAFASATHTITDFESGVDAIDISAALVAAGYTADNAPTQLASAEMSADILDLVNGDDSSLDNLFGATYDDASNTLTVFADSNSSQGATDVDSFQITLDENATVEDEDIVVNLSAFIA
jgi:cysteine synthase